MRPDVTPAPESFEDTSQGHDARDCWAFGGAANALGSSVLLTTHGPSGGSGVLAEIYTTSCSVDANGIVTTSEPCVVATAAKGCWARFNGGTWTEITTILDGYRFMVATPPTAGTYTLEIRQSYARSQAKVPASVGLVGNWTIVSACDPVRAATQDERFGPLISNLAPESILSPASSENLNQRFKATAICFDKTNSSRQTVFALTESGELYYSVAGFKFLPAPVALGGGWQLLAAEYETIALAKPGKVAISVDFGATFQQVDLPTQSPPTHISVRGDGWWTCGVITASCKVYWVVVNNSNMSVEITTWSEGPVLTLAEGNVARLASGVLPELGVVGLDRDGNVFTRSGYVFWYNAPSTAPDGYKRLPVSPREVNGTVITEVEFPYWFGSEGWVAPRAKASGFYSIDGKWVDVQAEAPVQQHGVLFVSNTGVECQFLVAGTKLRAFFSNGDPDAGHTAQVIDASRKPIWLPAFLSTGAPVVGLTGDGVPFLCSSLAWNDASVRFSRAWQSPSGRSSDPEARFLIFGNVAIANELYPPVSIRFPTEKQVVCAAVQSDGTLVCFVTSDGLLFKADGTQVSLPPGKTVNAVAVNGSAILAVGNGGFAYYSSDGGATWSTLTTGTSNDLLWTTICNDGGFFACGRGGTLLRYNAGSWTTLATGTTSDLYKVSSQPGGSQFVACGANNTAIYFSSLSASVQSVAYPTPPPSQTEYLDIHFTADGFFGLGPTIIVVGDGIAYCYTFPSLVYTLFLNPTYRLGGRLIVKGTGSPNFATETGPLALSAWDWTDWQVLMQAMYDEAKKTLHQRSVGGGRLVCTPYGVFTFDGSSLSPVVGQGVAGSIAGAMSGNYGFFARPDGVVFYTQDGGATWQMTSFGTPTAAAADSGIAAIFDNAGNALYLSAGGLAVGTTPFPVAFASAGGGTFWIFSSSGQVAKSSNPTAGWTAQPSVPANLVSAAGTGSSAAVLAVSGAMPPFAMRLESGQWVPVPAVTGDYVVAAGTSLVVVSASEIVCVSSTTPRRFSAQGMADAVGTLFGLLLRCFDGDYLVEPATLEAAAFSPFKTVSSSFGSNVFCAVDGYLLLFGTVEYVAGRREYWKRRVRWSVPLDPFDFSMVRYSGVAELPGSGDIIAAAPAGHSVIVFDTDGVAVLDSTGEPTAPWAYRRLSEGVVIASNPVSVGSDVLFVSTDGRLMVANQSGVGEAPLRKNIKPIVADCLRDGHGVALCHLQEAGALAIGKFGSDEWVIVDLGSFRATTWKFWQRSDTSMAYPAMLFSIPGRTWIGVSFGTVASPPTMAIGSINPLGAPTGSDTVVASVPWSAELITGELELAGQGMQFSVNKVSVGGRVKGAAPRVAAGVVSPNARPDDKAGVLDGGAGGNFTIAGTSFTAPAGKPLSGRIGTGDGVQTTFMTPVPAYRCVAYVNGVKTAFTVVGAYSIQFATPPPIGAAVDVSWIAPPEKRVRVGDFLERDDGALFLITQLTDAWNGVISSNGGNAVAYHRPAGEFGDGNWVGIGVARTLSRPKLRLLVKPQTGCEWCELDWITLQFSAPGADRWRVRE